jgi:nitroreductase
VGDKSSRKPSREYRALATNSWTLWDVIYGRRSLRKYAPFEPDERFAEELSRVIALALKARGAPGGSIIPVTDRDTGERIRKRSYVGITNKINLWLARNQVNAFLVIALPSEDMERDRPILLPRIAMALEDCVLWLTERGIGTCWLGGVNEREVRKALSLDEGTAVPAIVCFGEPGSGRLPGYDDLMVRTFSRRRKPLAEIAGLETADRPFRIGPSGGRTFEVSESQDVERLLDDLDRGGPGDSQGDLPLDIALEACLESARVAPSASNLQAWKFVAVTDRARLDELMTALPREMSRGTDAWRAAVVAAGMVGTMSSRMLDKPFWMLDVPIALSHMTLVAASMRMRVGVWTDGVDETAINRLVSLPDGWRSVGVMTVR